MQKTHVDRFEGFFFWIRLASDLANFQRCNKDARLSKDGSVLRV